MKERPILFRGAMVRAILDGSKTQTRRLVGAQSIRVGAHLQTHQTMTISEADPQRMSTVPLLTLREARAAAEKEHIVTVIASCDRLKKAAQILGVSAQHLTHLKEKHGLPIKKTSPKMTASK